VCETNDATKHVKTHDPHLNPKRRRITTSFTVSIQTLTMANSLEQTRPWFLYAVPLLVFLLIAFHVLALVKTLTQFFLFFFLIRLIIVDLIFEM